VQPTAKDAVLSPGSDDAFRLSSSIRSDVMVDHIFEGLPRWSRGGSAARLSKVEPAKYTCVCGSKTEPSFNHHPPKSGATQPGVFSQKLRETSSGLLENFGVIKSLLFA